MLKQYNTKVTSEEENIHVQQMYHKLGYNKRTTILTSQHMQDTKYGDDYVVGAVYAGDSGYISVDSVENVESNFEDNYELTIEELEKMVSELETEKTESYMFSEMPSRFYINAKELSREEVLYVLTMLENLGHNLLVPEEEYISEIEDGFVFVIVGDTNCVFTAKRDCNYAEITYQELKSACNQKQVVWVNTRSGELQHHNKGVKIKGSEWEVVPDDAEVIVRLWFMTATYKNQFKQVWSNGEWRNTVYGNENIKIWNNSPVLW